jgi:hypothetical protein
MYSYPSIIAMLKKLGFIIAFSIGFLSVTAGQLFVQSSASYSDMN